MTDSEIDIVMTGVSDALTYLRNGGKSVHWDIFDKKFVEHSPGGDSDLSAVDASRELAGLSLEAARKLRSSVAITT